MTQYEYLGVDSDWLQNLFMKMKEKDKAFRKYQNIKILTILRDYEIINRSLSPNSKFPVQVKTEYVSAVRSERFTVLTVVMWVVHTVLTC